MRWESIIVKLNLNKMWRKKISEYILNIIDFRDDTDQEATIAAIKTDIEFRGTTIWIMICSIFIASIGLNANSTAVVIGAMLISPLIGPILGIGMSVAINDAITLKKAIKNFLVMVIISILTAFLFFKLFPLNVDSSELLARTQPDIRDVLIAFFGGAALMIARTKKGTIASVIFGVSIATALMPPLCTAGYGLAKGGVVGFSYLAGALYLFIINALYISLSTFIVIKLLRFPLVEQTNSQRDRLIARYASWAAVLATIPAIWTFILVYNKNLVQNELQNLIQNEISVDETMQLINYDINHDEKVISMNFVQKITEAQKNRLLNLMHETETYHGLKDYNLKVKGSGDTNYEMMVRGYEDAQRELQKDKIIISSLERELARYENGENSNKGGMTEKELITFLKDLKIANMGIKGVRIENQISTMNFSNLDTNRQVIVEGIKDEELKKTIEITIKDFFEKDGKNLGVRFE